MPPRHPQQERLVHMSNHITRKITRMRTRMSITRGERIALGPCAWTEPEQLAGPGGWWRGLSAIVAVGLRPCSGAILVLVFALAQGLFWAGVASTFVMGLGTAVKGYQCDLSRRCASRLAAGTRISGFNQRGVLNGPSAIEEYLKSLFKAGFNHEEITVDDVSPLGADAVLVRGEYHITGQGQNGAIKIDGNWGAVNVREGGVLKIRLIMALPKPPPPK